MNYQKEQLQVARMNTKILNDRETEINHIVKSIVDLNELFKDLATMVVDQVLFYYNEVQFLYLIKHNLKLREQFWIESIVILNELVIR